jgi:hypothetical protein
VPFTICLPSPDVFLLVFVWDRPRTKDTLTA